MDEHDLSQPTKNQIGLTRKIRRVQPITKPHGMRHPPHRHFRPCIHAAHAGHLSAALGGRQFVHCVYLAAIQPFTCSLSRSSGSVPSRSTAS